MVCTQLLRELPELRDPDSVGGFCRDSESGHSIERIWIAQCPQPLKDVADLHFAPSFDPHILRLS